MEKIYTLYIALPNSSFEENEVVDLIRDFRPEVNCGLFYGLCNGEMEELMCDFNEFDVLDLEEESERTIYYEVDESSIVESIEIGAGEIIELEDPIEIKEE